MNKSAVNTKQYGIVDIVRLIMAICVLFIHRGYVWQNETGHFFVRNGICEIAVPFFVCTTAFFLFRKIKLCSSANTDKVCFKYIKHIAILFLLWTIVYIPVTLYKESFVLRKPFAEIAKTYLRNFLIGGQTYLHLWYIQALIVTAVAIFILQKFLSTEKLIFIFYLFYIIYEVGLNAPTEKIAFIYNKFPPALFNYFARITIFFVVGKLIAEKETEIGKIKKNIIGLCTTVAISIVFLILRYKFGNVFAILQMSLLPLVMYYFFSICISIDFSFKNQKDLRQFTELFYFTHLLMPVELYGLISDTCGKSELINNVVVVMIFFTVFSTVVSLLILKLSKTKLFGFLKYLY